MHAESGHWEHSFSLITRHQQLKLMHRNFKKIFRAACDN